MYRGSWRWYAPGTRGWNLRLKEVIAAILGPWHEYDQAALDLQEKIIQETFKQYHNHVYGIMSIISTKENPNYLRGFRSNKGK